MPPIESEVYNVVFETPGLTRDEIHSRCRSAATPSQTVAALQTLEELGRIEQRIVDKKRRYYATTQEQVDQAKAEKAAAERKAREKAIAKAAKSVTDQSPGAPTSKSGLKEENFPVETERQDPRKKVMDFHRAVGVPSKLVSLNDLEQETERARVLLERYLEDLNDPLLQALINAVHELESAVEAAQERAA